VALLAVGILALSYTAFSLEYRSFVKVQHHSITVLYASCREDLILHLRLE